MARLAGLAPCVLVAVIGSAQAQQAGAPGLVVSMPPAAGGAPQGGFPGVVVTAPPAAGAPMPSAPPGFVVTAPQGTPPPAASSPPAAKSKPKPKPKAATREASAHPAHAAPGSPVGIAALVNDEPVTAFAVEQLARFMALSVNYTDRAKANMQAVAQRPETTERLKAILKETIDANQGKTKEQVIALFEERKKQFVMNLQKQAVESARASLVPSLRKKALDELVEERLKYQEAKRVNVTVSDDDGERVFKSIAERNKMSSADFAKHIQAQGANPDVMKARLKTQLLWREVIRRRYGHMIAISNKEVDRVIATTAATDDQVELQLHKITLATTGKVDQKLIAQRYEEAEAIRSKFAGCKSTSAIAKDMAAAKFEDLSYRKPSSVAEPTRSLLLAAADGEMVPPHLTGSGVELYAVCGRRVGKADEQKRQAAESELQSKEFERMAVRLLQDLRKDALIEIR